MWGCCTVQAVGTAWLEQVLGLLQLGDRHQKGEGITEMCVLPLHSMQQCMKTAACLVFCRYAMAGIKRPAPSKTYHAGYTRQAGTRYLLFYFQQPQRSLIGVWAGTALAGLRLSRTAALHHGPAHLQHGHSAVVAVHGARSCNIHGLAQPAGMQHMAGTLTGVNDVTDAGVNVAATANAC